MSFKKIAKKRFLEISIMSLLIISLLLSGYFGSMKFGFMNTGDLSEELSYISHSYYLSKYHIWVESYKYFGLVVLLLIPILISTIYSNAYFEKSDIYTIYRKGLKEYLWKSYFKSLLVGAGFVFLSLLIYWLVLQFLPTTNQIFIYGTYNEYENIISPVIIINSFMKAIAIKSPESYILISVLIMTLGSLAYASFSMAIGNFIRQKFARILAPFLILLIIDVIINSILFQLPDSLVLGIYNPHFSISLPWLIIPSIVLLLVSTFLIQVHYSQRINNG